MADAAAPAGDVRRVALSVSFFCASSLGAIFVNKACLSHFRFAYPFTLMLLQLTTTVAAVWLWARAFPRRAPARVKRADLPRLALPAALQVANVAAGLFALTRVNIPMFSALRRLTLLFVLAAEFARTRRAQTPRVSAAVLLIAAGAFLSALGDATFSASGYALVLLNNALTAAYLSSIKGAMVDLSLSPLSLLYHVALLALPPVAALAVASGDLPAALSAYAHRADLRASPAFLPALAAGAASALCVNLATSVCTHVTSPLATAVAGQVKNALQTTLGLFSWGYVMTPLNLFGLLLALAAQAAFGVFKYQDARADAPAPPPDPPKPAAQ